MLTKFSKSGYTTDAYANAAWHCDACSTMSDYIGERCGCAHPRRMLHTHSGVTCDYTKYRDALPVGVYAQGIMPDLSDYITHNGQSITVSAGRRVMIIEPMTTRIFILDITDAIEAHLKTTPVYRVDGIYEYLVDLRDGITSDDANNVK